MGKLEKQIMIGALALVGVLVAVVILKGLAPREAEPDFLGESASTPPLMLEVPDGAITDPVMPQDPNLLTPDLLPQPGDSELIPGTNWLPLESQPLATDPLALPVPVVTPPAEDVPHEYVIKSGDTLGHVAQRELGSAKRVKEIVALNPGLVPEQLVVGAKIMLPARGAISAPVVKDSAATPPAVPSAPATSTMHTVAAGDTLWGLAERYLGNGERFREIVAANPNSLKNESSMLLVGTQLRIPKK